MKEPEFRCGARQAIEELAKELNLPYDSTMQDWPYDIEASDIETYISFYEREEDNDKKFVLMQLIIQATHEQGIESELIRYWNRVKLLLIKDFTLHEYSIYYWCMFDNEDVWSNINILMRELWYEYHRVKILFVCTVNRMRSATAHKIYEGDKRFEVKSAGTDSTANTVISIDLLEWADSIIVMEKHHRNKIRQKYPNIYKNKKIVCLYIEDEYDYMQDELITLLQAKVEDVYRRGLIEK